MEQAVIRRASARESLHSRWPLPRLRRDCSCTPIACSSRIVLGLSFERVINTNEKPETEPNTRARVATFHPGARCFLSFFFIVIVTIILMGKACTTFTRAY